MTVGEMGALSEALHARFIVPTRADWTMVQYGSRRVGSRTRLVLPLRTRMRIRARWLIFTSQAGWGWWLESGYLWIVACPYRVTGRIIFFA
jgi:hypothetical protein